MNKLYLRTERLLQMHQHDRYIVTPVDPMDIRTRHELRDTREDRVIETYRDRHEARSQATLLNLNIKLT